MREFILWQNSNKIHTPYYIKGSEGKTIAEVFSLFCIGFLCKKGGVQKAMEGPVFSHFMTKNSYLL